MKVGEPLPELSFRQKGLEVSNSDVVAAREKIELKNLAKAQAKRDREGVGEMIKKNKRVRKDLEPQGSGSVGTHLSATPSDSVALVMSLEALNDVNESCAIEAPPRVEQVTMAEAAHTATVGSLRRAFVTEGAGKKINSFPKEVVADFLPDHGVLPSPGENAHRGLSDVYPSHSADAEDSGVGELVTHLATPAEDEFLQSLSNVEVVRRAYESLGCCANADLSREFSSLSDVHSSCTDREKELLGTQLAAAEDRVHFLEEGNVQLTAGMAKKEMTRHRLIKEFVPDVVRKLHMSVKEDRG
ncbi:hypothetical protein Tco_1395459 [Tanacetum coccineum]